MATDVREQLLEHGQQRSRRRIRDCVERADEPDTGLARQHRPLIAEHPEDLLAESPPTLAPRLEPVDRGAEIADRLVEVVDDALDPNAHIGIGTDDRRNRLERHSRREQSLDHCVVEVAGDALAVLEDGQLLRGPLELLPRRDPISHVAYRRHGVLLVTRLHGAQADLDRDLAAVLAPRVKQQPASHRTGSWVVPEPGAVRSVRFVEAFREEVLDRPADEVGSLEAEQDLGLAVHEDDHAARVDHDQGVRCELDDLLDDAVVDADDGDATRSPVGRRPPGIESAPNGDGPRPPPDSTCCSRFVGVRALRYVRYEDLEGTPNVVVDGSAGPDTRIVLSHWPGSPTPDVVRADLSAQIALLALDHPELFDGIDAVSNNHFDQDGLMSVYALTDPEGASSRRDRVIDVARAGDFGWYESRDAARIAMAIAVLADPEMSPLDARTFEGDPTGALYEELLGRLPALLDDIEATRPWWEAEDAHLAESEAAITGGVVTIEEKPEVDLAIVRIPDASADRLAHRFTQTWTGALHPMAVNGATQCFRVLVLHRGRARLECRYETWVQFVSRPVVGRPDLRELAAALDRAEGAARWQGDPPGALTPVLKLREAEASTLGEDRIVDEITKWLATAPPAWDPFATAC